MVFAIKKIIKKNTIKVKQNLNAVILKRGKYWWDMRLPKKRCDFSKQWDHIVEEQHLHATILEVKPLMMLIQI